MKVFGSAVVLLPVSTLVGCVATKPQHLLPGPAEIAVTGTYQHVVTKLEFPETIGPFSRSAVRRYDPEALNVSGHYRLLGTPPAIATVYHYPATVDGSEPTDDVLMQRFRGVQDDMLRENPALYLIEASPFHVSMNGLDLRGFRVVYQAPRSPSFDVPVDSIAYLFAVGPWFLKFRFTYPLVFAAYVEPLEQQFISSIRWEVPAPPDSAHSANACVRLADGFKQLAGIKDMGFTREMQLELLESLDPPVQEAVRVDFLNTLDVVYAHPDKNASQIRSLVLADCELDHNGQAALRTLRSSNR